MKRKNVGQIGRCRDAKPVAVKSYSSLKCIHMSRDKREKRDLHALSEEGMVLCNPRDKEAAHRAHAEGIATDNWAMVTCRKCVSLLHKLEKARRERHGDTREG